ncbi:AraC-type DNA-binding protein [Acetitomaculum ruminis DSM 5522]|uniref:AraC-type DNA-binding protein n=1 Tax=Acetitomaculum ruminis DSM 5522 TaxID=1120918 RepID=A0A1I0W3E9_9FIRM|nr:AraC family transcriptional regulator [Acetitomaculum ruminis]SFA82877.1 AraC-type DNA-binding protein [Acetitomaculum ruminis DSM 5522]
MKKVKQMEVVLEYILEHIDEDRIDFEKMAAQFKYNPSYLALAFRDHFEISFHKYVNKLQMRKAARLIYNTKQTSRAVKESRYVLSMGFSNAFKNEIGVSPRAFLNRNVEVPDMPLKKEILGLPLSMEYKITDSFNIAGFSITPKQKDEADLLDNTAYAYGYPRMTKRLTNKKEWYGLWWNNEKDHLIYVLAQKATEDENYANGKKFIHIPQARYAIFSFPKLDDVRKTVKAQRYLAHYIFKEWMVINEKTVDPKGITYEFYNEDSFGIAVPLAKGMYGYDSLENSGRGCENWTKYIDEHYKEEDFNVSIAARYFEYDKDLFEKIFWLRYGVSVDEYLKNKRVFGEGYNAVNLFEFYKKNKEKIKISYMRIRKFYVSSKPVEKFGDGKIDERNIVDLVKVAFEEDAKKYIGKTDKDNKELTTCGALWHEYEDADGETHYDYVEGPTFTRKAALPTDKRREKIEVKGGYYAVIETLNENDTDNFKENYELLDKCGFHGWVKERRYHFDQSRISFVSFRNNKLYFYVPVIANKSTENAAKKD